jgi:subtilisin family serine protease
MISLPKHEVKEVGPFQSLSQIVDWSIQNTDIPEIWKTTRGKGVRVVVIDTGEGQDHPDLKSNPFSTSFISNEQTAKDLNGHGTAVSGMIAAIDNSFGVVGVAPDAEIISVKALNRRGNATGSEVTKALEYALSLNPDIVNLSLGSTEPFIRGKEILQKFWDKNIPVVCAAGNMGNQHAVMYPAKYTQTIAVGAYDSNKKLSKFSCMGPEVHFAAPGEDVLLPYSGGTYAVLSGTSFAAPFVAGIIALIIAHHYEKTGKKHDLTVKEIISMVDTQCLNIDDIEPKNLGILNMEKHSVEKNGSIIKKKSWWKSLLSLLRL